MSPPDSPATGPDPAAQSDYLMALEAPDPTPAPGQHPAAATTVYPTAEYPLAVPAGPPGRGGGLKVAVVLLSVLAGLALAGNGLLAVLWWGAAQDRDDLDRALAAVEQELAGERADHDEAVQSLERDLQRTSDDLASVRQELEGAETMVEVLRGEQGVIRQCVALNAEVLEAIVTGDQARFDAVIDELEEVCDEADQILGG